MSISKEFGIIVLLCVYVSLIQCSESGEYYWRPWTAGSPPSDAVTARDYRGVSYIVEAYTPLFGEFIGQAFANQQEVNVTAIYANKSQAIVQKGYSLKVLCTQNLEKLAWYPTNQKTFENELITGVINPVVGGYDNKDEVLYVGRYVDLSIRSIFFGSIGDSYRLHYYYAGRAIVNVNFEVLIIDNKKCK